MKLVLGLQGLKTNKGYIRARAYAGPVLTTHEERVQVLRAALEKCRERGWTYDTKAIADRVAPLFQGLGYTQSTVKGLVRSVVDLLLVEKRTGKTATVGS